MLKKEIWILVEHRDGEVEEATLEVLSEAKRLAGKAKSSVSALVLGHSAEAFVDTLSQQGADVIYHVPHELLETYTTDGYTAALAELITSREPWAFILAGTAMGRDLAPRLATRLKTGLVSDCRVLDISRDGALEMTRPTCGGRVYTRMTGDDSGTKIVTVRPGVLGVGKALRGRKAEIEVLETSLKPEMIRTRVLGISAVDREELDIIEAEFVLAFGRGLGDEAYMSQMTALAKEMDACIAGSRAAVDERWVTFDRQIGQTGKTIAPKVIVCCGISGAQQFVMGMRDSRFIIAVNKDKRAPIFKVADMSVLGDMHEVVPALTEVLQSMK